MQSFRDSQGRLWDLSVTVAAVRRVKALTGVDLYALLEDGFGPLADLLSDPCKLADVLYAVCRPAAEERQVTDEQFGEALAGDVLDAASEALVQAVIDFFPQPEGREHLRRVVRKGREVGESLLREQARRLEDFDPQAFARRLAAGGPPPATSGGSSGTSPASPASTPGP